MLAGDQCPHILSENTIRLKLKENVDLMSIYVQILTNSMNRSLECPLDSHLLQRIVTITVDVCKRV